MSNDRERRAVAQHLVLGTLSALAKEVRLSEFLPRLQSACREFWIKHPDFDLVAWGRGTLLEQLRHLAGCGLLTVSPTALALEGEAPRDVLEIQLSVTARTTEFLSTLAPLLNGFGPACPVLSIEPGEPRSHAAAS